MLSIVQAVYKKMTFVTNTLTGSTVYAQHGQIGGCRGVYLFAGRLFLAMSISEVAKLSQAKHPAI